VVFDCFVYFKLWVVFGGCVDLVIFGGVLFGEWLVYFFCGIGVIVFEGYGFIEIMVVVMVNMVYE